MKLNREEEPVLAVWIDGPAQLSWVHIELA
jgi:hypothetical protein